MKIKLGIFFGGKSVEHEIAVITAVFSSLFHNPTRVIFQNVQRLFDSSMEITLGLSTVMKITSST